MLERIAEGTAPIDPNDIFRQHEETWELVTEAVLEHTSPRAGTPLPSGKMNNFLPILRFMVSLPEAFYDEDKNYLRGQVLARYLGFHRELNRGKGMVGVAKHLEFGLPGQPGVAVPEATQTGAIRLERGSDQGRGIASALPVYHRGIRRGSLRCSSDETSGGDQASIETTRNHDAGWRVAGTASDRVLREFGYFSSIELESCARDLAAVMGYPDRAWSDLLISGVSREEMEAKGMKDPYLRSD